MFYSTTVDVVRSHSVVDKKYVDLYEKQPIPVVSPPPISVFFPIFISRSCHLYSYISSSVAVGWLSLMFFNAQCVYVCLCVCVYSCLCTCQHSIFNPFYLKIKRKAGD